MVRRPAAAELELTFRLEGDIRRIRIAPPAIPRVSAELWRHTCFECFIAIDGQSAYHEFNFAPSREWALYAFRGYRDGGLVADESMRPHITTHPNDDLLEVLAVARLDRLSPMHSRARLRVGLSAVVEDDCGLSYWALRHPAGKADFHHADGFALHLEPPGSD